MKKLLLAVIALSVPSAQAYDQIYRPFLSARSAGMGSTRIVTGQYEDNFFGNPALVVDNPKWKISLLDLTLETNSSAISHASNIISAASDDNGNVLREIAQTTGANNHLRIQTALPSVYIPAGENGRLGFALGLLMNTQFDLGLRRNYQVDPQLVTDIGPAFTVGRMFLPERQLAIGATAHVTYRVASKPDYDTVDLLTGTSMSPTVSGGEGAHVDADVGARWRFDHFQPLGFQFTAGAAINNVLGGKYSSLNLDLLDTTNKPRAQPRSFGVGLGARRESLGPFSDFIAALEITDIGNNTNGSMWRTVHLGAEAKFAILTPRVGINQGYFTAGLGINLKILTLDFATYGEELSLNVGGLQDRRYTMKIALQI